MDNKNIPVAIVQPELTNAEDTEEDSFEEEERPDAPIPTVQNGNVAERNTGSQRMDYVRNFYPAEVPEAGQHSQDETHSYPNGTHYPAEVTEAGQHPQDRIHSYPNGTHYDPALDTDSQRTAYERDFYRALGEAERMNSGPNETVPDGVYQAIAWFGGNPTIFHGNMFENFSWLLNQVILSIPREYPGSNVWGGGGQQNTNGSPTYFYDAVPSPQSFIPDLGSSPTFNPLPDIHVIGSSWQFINHINQFYARQTIDYLNYIVPHYVRSSLLSQTRSEMSTHYVENNEPTRDTTTESNAAPNLTSPQHHSNGQESGVPISDYNYTYSGTTLNENMFSSYYHLPSAARTNQISYVLPNDLSFSNGQTPMFQTPRSMSNTSSRMSSLSGRNIFQLPSTGRSRANVPQQQHNVGTQTNRDSPHRNGLCLIRPVPSYIQIQHQRSNTLKRQRSLTSGASTSVNSFSPANKQNELPSAQRGVWSTQCKKNHSSASQQRGLLNSQLTDHHLVDPQRVSHSSEEREPPEDRGTPPRSNQLRTSSIDHRLSSDSGLSVGSPSRVSPISRVWTYMPWIPPTAPAASQRFHQYPHRRRNSQLKQPSSEKKD